MILRKKKFPFYRQMDAMDCGPTCLRMIAKSYGKAFSLPYLREKCYITREGVSLKGISEAAETIGLRSLAVKIPFSDIKDKPSLITAPLPLIAHWNQKHFLVVYKANKTFVWVADPGEGQFKLSRKEFEKHWIQDNQKGIALLLEPTASFHDQEEIGTDSLGFSFLLRYIKPYKNQVFQLIVALILTSLFQLIFPFLTQSIVDIGIENQDINFIYLILAAQLMLFLGQISVRFIQSWILLHMSTRINVNLISDFLIKLMRLPLSFFDTKMIGDLLQRISDHRRIEQFLTGSTLSILLSFFNVIIFGIVLLIYNVNIFLVFLVSSILYIAWITFFLKKRKAVDYLAFQQYSDNHNSLIEMIQGMPEIKLQGSQQKRRWQWTHIQAKLFRTQIKSLSISQYQDVGASFINQLKDILISFIAALAVIQGEMTLGMMLAVQYIIGQLNGPLNQMMGFVRSAQDAKISLERLGEIHQEENEEGEVALMNTVPLEDIQIENLSFKYTPVDSEVLTDVNLTIPRGKVTAIVGMSGSGKTTLVKLLLGFYKPTKGSIKIGHVPLPQIRQKLWRKHCGVVMQEGYIFSDTIANNIAESDDLIDQQKLLRSVKTANIQGFIEELPMGYNTMIGARGNGLSQGQRQRLQIARAVYKSPDFLFFDEATNALDAKNERIIVENLNAFFEDRTVVVVAHRLSTVKKADQIIVLEDGKVKEIGNHAALIAKKGTYFSLVSDQLELGGK